MCAKPEALAKFEMMNGISQPWAEWAKAKEKSGTMMTTIGHIEPHSSEIIISGKIHLYGKLLDAFSVELWLCARVSRQQTGMILDMDICEGNHWIRHLTQAFARLAQLKLFHFAISIKWSIWKCKKCTQFIYSCPQWSHYTIVRFIKMHDSACGRMMKTFTNPSKVCVLVCNFC